MKRALERYGRTALPPGVHPPAEGGHSHVAAQGLPLPLSLPPFSSCVALGVERVAYDLHSIRVASFWVPHFFGKAPTTLLQSWRLSSMVERLVSLRAGPWFDSTSSLSDCVGVAFPGICGHPLILHPHMPVSHGSALI